MPIIFKCPHCNGEIERLTKKLQKTAWVDYDLECQEEIWESEEEGDCDTLSTSCPRCDHELAEEDVLRENRPDPRPQNQTRIQANIPGGFSNSMQALLRGERRRGMMYPDPMDVLESNEQDQDRDTATDPPISHEERDEIIHAEEEWMMENQERRELLGPRYSGYTDHQATQERDIVIQCPKCKGKSIMKTNESSICCNHCGFTVTQKNCLSQTLI